MARLTPQEVREQDFKQAPLGYNKDQVNQFLDEIADELENFIRESNELHVEIKAIELTLKTYTNVEDALKETLLLAQQAAQDTLKNAQNEADIILRKANSDKDALLFSAKEDLSNAQSAIRTLQTQRDAILVKLKSILRSNLEVLDQEFSEDEKIDDLLTDSGTLKDERIVDFSKSDLVIEDLEADVEPEISISDEEAVPDE